jgi:hypothetical protein
MLQSGIYDNRSIINLPKVRSVVADPSNPHGDRLVLLRVSEEGVKHFQFRGEEFD